MTLNIKNSIPLALSFALCANVAQADDLDFTNLNCVDSKGKTVQYIKVSNEAMQKEGGLFAFAAIIENQPVIVYETEFLGQFSKSFQAMAMAHECAHHKNGDTYSTPQPTSSDPNAHFETVVISREDHADQAALEYLINEENYGEKEISEIVSAWEQLILMVQKRSPRSVPFIEDKPQKIHNYALTLLP
jgi:hypothetical protein